MGARLTRIATKRGQETQFAEFGDSKEKQIGDSLVNVPHGQARIFLANEYNNFSIQSLMEQTSKNNKHSLQELQMKSPPGFKAFESAVDLRALDEETALKLWEDIFKPLYTFEFEGEAKGSDKCEVRIKLTETTKQKKKSLKQLQLESPPGFERFESSVAWRTLDEETALELWEDIFKPLYTFELVTNKVVR